MERSTELSFGRTVSGVHEVEGRGWDSVSSFLNTTGTYAGGGGACGLIAGAWVGSIAGPVVGSAVGAAAGGIIGGGVGLIVGAALWFQGERR